MKIWKHRAAVAAEAAVQVDPPTEYYTSRYSGEEIDKGIDGALQLGGASTPQGAIAALGAGVRPNLLVNPFFKINQRNQNSYSSEGYAVDCWRVNSIGTILNVEENGIHLSQPSGSSGAFLIRQDIENSKDLYGKKITLSVLVDSSDSHVNFFVGSRTENTNMRSYTDLINGPGLYTATLLVSQEVDDICVVCRRTQITGELSIGIVAVKLEIGDSQTLAYQDSSGTWNLLEQPDPLELLKCQRYFYYANNILCPGQIKNGSIFLAMYLPTKMRVIPSMTVKSYGTIINNGVSNVPTTFDRLVLSGNILQFRTNAPANTANHTPCVLTDLNAEISAEL